MTLPRLDARAAALFVAGLAALTVGAALALQWAGYSPCELCLRERVPYYVGIALALATWLAALRGLRLAAIAGFVALILVFMLSTALGLYHAGVEAKLWAGPSECSGVVAAPASVTDFMEQLKHVAVVRCDAVALRIFGLSLTVWNAVLSVLLIGLANVGLLRVGSVGRSRITPPPAPTPAPARS